MKKVILVLILMPLFTYGQKLSIKDSVQISSMIKDWDTAWNIKDFQLASKWYSDDARFVNAFGDKRNGQKEVQDLLKEVFSLPFVMAGNSQTLEHQYQILNSNTVVVHTAILRKGQQMPDGTAIPERQTTHMRVFEKGNNGWMIKAHLISDARDKQAPKH
jgi:uncharacterized protein (TIGR02246 family)